MTLTDVPPNGDCFYNVIQLSLATLPEPVTTNPQSTFVSNANKAIKTIPPITHNKQFHNIDDFKSLEWVEIKIDVMGGGRVFNFKAFKRIRGRS